MTNMGANERYNLRSDPQPGLPNQDAILGDYDLPTIVEVNKTEAKMKMSGKAGRLPPRWVLDLRKSDMVEVKAFDNIRKLAEQRSGESPHIHDFIMNGKQSTPEGYKHGILSCVCSGCDYHFVIKTYSDLEQDENCLCNTRNMNWPTTETQFLVHHLVWIESMPTAQVQQKKTKYNPLVAVERFACSAPPCTFELTLEISEPRVSMPWIQLLTDSERVRKQLQLAKLEDPKRYAEAKDNWITTAVPTLNTYVKDALETDARRPISKRNRRFHVVFGEQCYPIFQALEFQETVVEKDEVFEEFFIPTSLEPRTPDQLTELNTVRAFLEDVRSELQSLIIRQGIKNSITVASAVNRMDQALNCFQYPRVPTATADPDLAEFKALGVTPDCSRDLVLYAFHRQVALKPQKRHLLATCLGEVATQGRVDSFLQEAAAIEISKLGPADDSEVGMTLDKALRFFDVGEEFPTDLILDISRRKFDSIRGNKPKEEELMTALEVIRAGRARNNEEISDAQIASVRTPFDSDFRIELGNDGTANNATRMDLPVGLENIGNTCYLNSLLQYLFTVKPVVDVTVNFADYKLDLTESSIGSRRLGGTRMTMDRPEAVVAQAFVNELASLFDNLKSTQRQAIRPTQRLANAVLLSTHQLSQGTTAKVSNLLPEVMGAQFPTPPPLPARPSPAPPVEPVVLAEHVGQVEHVEDAEDVDMVNVSVDPVCETASNSFEKVDTTQELKSATNDNTGTAFPQQQSLDEAGQYDSTVASKAEAAPADIVMTDVDAPEPVDEKVLNALEHQKRSSGTDQQDVEEVMGSIINRLQAAIKPTSVLPDGTQPDQIMETFYVKSANYTLNAGETSYKAEITLDRSITAYPAEAGSCSIYEALDRNFDRQNIEGTKTLRFTSIMGLSPILHVLIQRTKKTGDKNRNPVAIAEMLYLDRYMDAPEGSQAFALRRRAWDVQRRVEELTSNPDMSLEEQKDVYDFVDDYVTVDKKDAEELFSDLNSPSLLANLPSSDFGFDGELLSFPSPPPSSDSTVESIDPLLSGQAAVSCSRDIHLMRDNELKDHQKEIDGLFSSMQNQAYRLHAVICHAGQLSAGHYWVWIHDFEAGVWRKYNDRVVTENPDTEDVLKLLNSGGEPYYLCYVRADRLADFVSVPKREPQLQPADDQYNTETKSPLSSLNLDVEGERLLADGVVGMAADSTLPSYSENDPA